jgi:hypothetical protein
VVNYGSSQSQSYFTTDGQPSSTHLRPKTRFLLLSVSCGFVEVGRPLRRENGSVVYNCCWPSPSRSFSDPSPAILLPHIRDSPNLEGQDPAFISPRNMVAQLYPHALSSLSVASYDSQGYGGGIRTRLHTSDSLTMSRLVTSLYNFGTTVSSNSSIAACASVAS